MTDLTDLKSIAALFDERQTARILTLAFPQDDGPAGALLPDTLHAQESLSRDFRFEVHCISEDARIALKDVLGKLVTISLVREDGSQRHFSGHAFEFRLDRVDGGFAFYTLVLRPWMAWLHLRRDNRIFHGQRLSQIIDATVSGALPNVPHPFELRLLGSDPVFTDCVQYAESDHNFLHRRLEAAGWHYRWEHRADGHTLVISDDSPGLPPIDADSPDSPDIAYQAEAGAFEGDAIAQWSAQRQAASARVSLRSFDFKCPRPQEAGEPSINDQGDVPALESYDYLGAYAWPDGEGADGHVRTRIEHLEAQAKLFHAQGNARAVQPGRWFRLSGHFDTGPFDPEIDQQYLVVDAVHRVTNNLQTGRTPQPPQYDNEFTCLRKKIPWRPGLGRSSHPVRIDGVQTALVVGPEGEEVYTDEFARVRVQFHWDRLGSFDQYSSAWVRVSSTLAGENYGQISLPRVGQEVIVQFLDGNPDRPIVTGRVVNADNRPTAFSHEGSLPGNRALAGLKTREFKGSRYNQLRLDDTTGQISAQLASEHAHSQLNLGYLTHPRRDGSGEARGDGFELRTDGSGAIRTARSLLISAWQRLEAAGDQLDADQHLALMQDALDLFKSLGDYAAQHQGAAADAAAHERINKDAADAAAPVLGLTSPAGIAATTPSSIVHCAGVNIDHVAQQHLQFTSGGRFSVNAGQGASVFSHQGGITAIAHHGRLLAQSQHDDTQIDSAKDIKLSAAGKLLGIAHDEVTFMTSGGAYLKLAGGTVELGGPGRLTVKTNGHHWEGPASMSGPLPSFSEAPLNIKRKRSPSL